MAQPLPLVFSKPMLALFIVDHLPHKFHHELAFLD
jgi:hypothetical protein